MEDTVHKWYALRVRTKCEDSVSFALRGKGYETFLPAYSEEVGLRSLSRPYFPGYLFCRFIASSRLPILKTPNVLHVVSLGGGPTAVSEEEIDSLNRLVVSGVKPTPYPYLREGVRVRISRGPMDGLCGIVVRQARHSRLVLSVDLLMRSVSVEIDESLVEALPPCPHGQYAARQLQQT